MIEWIGPNGFWFKGTVVRWIDADTVLVDSQIHPDYTYTPIRLKDRWEPEIGEDGEDIARAKAEAMFPPGCLVRMTNTKAERSFLRIVARVDRSS